MNFGGFCPRVFIKHNPPAHRVVEEQHINIPLGGGGGVEDQVLGGHQPEISWPQSSSPYMIGTHGPISPFQKNKT